MEEAMAQRIESPPVGTWTIDPAHSTAGFVARHLMVTKVRGRFTDVEGRLVIGETPEASSVEVRMKAASIDTASPDRDRHLRSPDFLDVERFPQLVFRSTGIEITGETALRITGDLTIRDVTKRVVLDAEYEGLARDPWGGTRISFSATTEIDRERWGITWNQRLETGGVLVSKQVKIELDVQAKLEESGGLTT
jgi:polyisoprenoid-binding protein YceI